MQVEIDLDINPNDMHSTEGISLLFSDSLKNILSDINEMQSHHIQQPKKVTYRQQAKIGDLR